ncbi:MAG: hypothetical protein ACLFQX_05925 [Candidatus Kapaibacterium sp.]
MSNNKDIFRDILRNSPEDTPAPDFTDKVMQRVISESISKSVLRKPSISRFPIYISILLIVAAVFFPAFVGKSDIPKTASVLDYDIPLSPVSDALATVSQFWSSLASLDSLYLIIALGVLALLAIDLLLKRSFNI